MKHLIAVLLLAFFGAGFAALAAEPVGAAKLKDKARSAEPVGVVIRGNQLKAMPGYVLEKGPNKQVLARPAGGGLGHSIECACHGGTGNCSVGFSGDSAICFTSQGGPCSGKCEWKVGRSMKISK